MSEATEYDPNDYLPEGAALDLSEGIRVNVSDEESAVRDFSPLPKGWYPTNITEVKVQAVKDEKADGTPNKNAGKPMYNFEFTVIEGHPSENRKMWTLACLWDGALYTIVGILQALGQSTKPGELRIPPAAWFEGKRIDVYMGTNRKDKDPVTQELQIKPRSFRDPNAKSKTGAKLPAGSPEGSLLP
jgi:hypothetical protein